MRMSADYEDQPERYTVVHLTASSFFGGPERQILELARELKPHCQTTIASFSEGGRSHEFLRRARQQGVDAVLVPSDTPHLLAAKRDVISLLRRTTADVLICHGYKAGILGLLAARTAGIGVIAVSRGWTAESARVRLYESLDRRVLRWMDHVVCVSQGQADKVLRAGVPGDRVSVIHNAVRCQRFAAASPGSRTRLASYFPSPPRLIVGAAGRLSPEKGFEILVQAAARVRAQCADVGFLLFGEGALRSALQDQVAASGLQKWFVMPGFRDDLDELLPALDLFCSSSYSEGLPNVLLEAQAAGVPVVATAVGGTPEVVAEGVTGFLVPAGCASAMAGQIARLASDGSLRERLGASSPGWVREQFSFTAQATSYRQLFRALCLATPSEASLVHAST